MSPISYTPSPPSHLMFCTAILTLRVYALFNCDRGILALLSLAGLGSIAVGVVRAIYDSFRLQPTATAVARNHWRCCGSAPRK